MTAAAIAARLRAAIDEGLALFAAMDATRTAQVPPGGGWCAREVVGHLIDSACNNHRRFVIGQSSSDLVFDGYDGDEWVGVQRYAQVPWRDLVNLWSAYNRHLAHVIDVAPDDLLARRKSPHNYDRILGEEFPSEEPQTLATLMDDYVSHMRHHFDQVRRLIAD